MLTKKQKQSLDKLIRGLDESQKMWLAGYISGLISGKQKISFPGNSSTSHNHNDIPVTILYGSRSGNSEYVAAQLTDLLTESGIYANRCDMARYDLQRLTSEKFLVVVVSTHGDGNPPAAAEEFYEFIHSESAPLLNCSFAVCALGDSAYEHFCKAGIDIDDRLSALGAKRMLNCVNCDIDFDESANGWIENIVARFTNNTSEADHERPRIILRQESGITRMHGKENPFPARIVDKRQLTAPKSVKEVYHLEISVEGSGMEYQPGDSLGIVPENSEVLVDAILKKTRFDGSGIVNNGVGALPLKDIFLKYYELTTLSKKVISQYAALTKIPELDQIVGDSEMLRSYIRNKDVLDLLEDYPLNCAPEEFLHILRRLQPRMYSIASSPKVYGERVHITVGAIRSTLSGRNREGVCSSFLTGRMDIGDEVPVYFDPNPLFKLPEENNTDIVMLGTGTGIAPFRGFLQERLARNAKGKAWLFLGARHHDADYLYKADWQKFMNYGVLTHLDLAFSRDTSKKIYVQDKMLERAEGLYKWIREGAHIYVCGDMRNMASDVFNTFIQIVVSQGQKSADEARAFIRHLQKENRYQEDVY
jgi:sulfite reductase (NADPH) flavoprotein alpha-component